MDLALVENNVPRQLSPREAVILPSGAKIPVGALQHWTEPERNAVNVYEIGTAVETVPSNKKIVGRELRFDQPSNTVKWHDVLADLPLDERKTTMRAQVDSKRATQTAAGYSHDFGPGLGGVHVLDTAPQNETGWIHYRNSCKEMIDAGNGALIMTLPITDEGSGRGRPDGARQSGHAGMVGMRDREGMIVQHARSLRDNIRAATDHAALDAINIETEWPV